MEEEEGKKKVVEEALPYSSSSLPPPSTLQAAAGVLSPALLLILHSFLPPVSALSLASIHRVMYREVVSLRRRSPLQATRPTPPLPPPAPHHAAVHGFLKGSNKYKFS